MLSVSNSKAELENLVFGVSEGRHKNRLQRRAHQFWLKTATVVLCWHLWDSSISSTKCLETFSFWLLEARNCYEYRWCMRGQSSWTGIWAPVIYSLSPRSCRHTQAVFYFVLPFWFMVTCFLYLHISLSLTACCILTRRQNFDSTYWVKV